MKGILRRLQGHPRIGEATAYPILFTIGFCHLLNDMIQSVIPAMYPVLKESYGFTFAQIGLITLVFQLTSSIFQPFVGAYADRHPQPYSLSMGMCLSLAGLLGLAFSTRYAAILLTVALIGGGSSVFHPEASRVAQMASGGRKSLEKLQERLAKLSGGVAVLYVGAATEVEMKEKKDRVDDALAATRAAVEEGIVPGGGVAYIRATSALEGMKGENEDQTTGIQIVKRAIEEPLRQIVANAGGEGSVVVNKVREGKDAFGYNARDDKYEDMLKAGIIDPTKVSRVALENAASIASMFLTTECVLAEKKSEQPAVPAMPGGGMGGMM